MNGIVKKIIITLCILGALLLAGYGAYKGYLYLVEDATTRIKKGVSQGVSEGVGKGLGGAINPLNWLTGK